MITLKGSGFVSTWFALALTLGAARAQDSVLYGESHYTNERCLPPCACALPPIEGRLFGTYTLTLVSIGSVTDFYTIDNGLFSLHLPGGGTLTLIGSGQYRHSEILGQHSMRLEMLVGNAVAPIVLDSGFVPLEVALPAIRIDLSNTSIACNSYDVRFVGGPATPCLADLDDGEGLGIHDNAVDVNDLVYFLQKFEAGDEAVDFAGPCDCPDCFCPDGAVDISDLLFFLRRFEVGC